MRGDRDTPSPGRRRQRAIALLAVLLTWAVLVMIVFQMETATVVAYRQVAARLRERQCRRALDSVPGLVTRMLSEKSADLAVDTPADEWAWPKYFDIGDVRVEIAIADCDGRYDLKSLLEENQDLLGRNKAQFVAFAEDCGLERAVAARVAEVIALEGEARRLEDAAFLERLTGEPPDTAAVKAMVPLWLETFLSLPDFGEDDRRAIRAAAVTRQDPVTLEPVTVRLLDQITIWRSGAVNVNTAEREVLLHAVPGLEGHEAAVDEILKRRADQPFRSVSQVGNVAALTRDEARQVASRVRLNSTRFRVTATATLRSSKPGPHARKAAMTLVVERRGQQNLYTLWRQTNL